MLCVKLPIMLMFILLSTINIYGQKKKINKQKSIEKTTVIDFGDEQIEKDYDDADQPLKLIVKTNPFSFFYGHQLIEVEKEVSNWFSMQVGVGLTFKNLTRTINALDEFVSDDNRFSPFSDQWEADITDDYFNHSRKSRLGYGFSLAPRIFLKSEGYEGYYVAPAFTYKRFNFIAQDVEIGNIYEKRLPVFTDKEQVSNTDLTLRFGHSTIYDELMTETFIGLGYRSTANHRQDVGYESGGYIGKSYQEFNQSSFRFECGIRIGFLFD